LEPQSRSLPTPAPVKDERDGSGEVSARVPDNVSFLISDERYCTKTGGDEEYYDAFEAECVRAMGELVTGWRSSRSHDELVGIEDQWAEFTECVRSIASRTIGTKQAHKNKHQGGGTEPSRRPTVEDLVEASA
jgi:hypothetical protein